MSTVQNPADNNRYNCNNDVTDLAKNLMHQVLIFAEIKSNTGQESRPDDGSQAAIKHEFPEGHTTHSSRNTD